MARKNDSPQNSAKFVSYKDIKKLMADLKLVYAAPTEETALNGLELFKDKWDSKYQSINHGMTIGQPYQLILNILRQSAA